MGQTIKSIFAFGVPIAYGKELPWDKAPFDGDFSEWWAEERGFPKPSQPYSNATKDLYSVFWDKERELEQECIAQIETHCCGEDPMYFVALRGTAVTVYRDAPEQIKTAACVLDPAKVAALEAFCIKYGIEWKEPGWYVMVYSD